MQQLLARRPLDPETQSVQKRPQVARWPVASRGRHFRRLDPALICGLQDCEIQEVKGSKSFAVQKEFLYRPGVGRWRLQFPRQDGQREGLPLGTWSAGDEEERVLG